MSKKKTLTVVLLEDDGISLMLLADVLTERGHLVLTYKRGKRLLEDAEQELMYDVAVIDRTLEYERGIDGDDVVKRLKQLYPKRPIISSSAYNKKSPCANDHIIKPFHMIEEFIPLVEKMAN